MHGRHCPFLNRNDARCAEHFRVSRLQHAFDHCFNSYANCPSYRQMLDERNGRPCEAPSTACGASLAPVVTLTIQGRHAATFRQLRHCGHRAASAA